MVSIALVFGAHALDEFVDLCWSEGRFAYENGLSPGDGAGGCARTGGKDAGSVVLVASKGVLDPVDFYTAVIDAYASPVRPIILFYQVIDIEKDFVALWRVHGGWGARGGGGGGVYRVDSKE